MQLPIGPEFVEALKSMATDRSTSDKSRSASRSLAACKSKDRLTLLDQLAFRRLSIILVVFTKKWALRLARHLLGALSSIVAEEHNAQDLYRSVLEGPFVHELMVTNYAGYQVRTEYGNLKVENLFTRSPSIIPALQKVSVLTVNGRLGMTLAARDVFPTLLEDAREILTQA